MSRRAVSLLITLPLGLVVLLVLALAAGWAPRAWNPFAPLVVADAPTPVLRLKLLRAAHDPAYCQAALATAQLRSAPIPQDSGEADCPLHDALRVTDGALARLNSSFPASCRLALSYALFERHALQPLAQRHYGQKVAQVSHLGSYACRAIRGGAGGDDAPRSEHASADAIDIAGFILADGRRIAIKRDWAIKRDRAAGAAGDASEDSAFLHDLHDAACRYFGNVLGPDYNAAHATHFHLGTRGMGYCR